MTKQGIYIQISILLYFFKKSFNTVNYGHDIVYAKKFSEKEIFWSTLKNKGRGGKIKVDQNILIFSLEIFLPPPFLRCVVYCSD